MSQKNSDIVPLLLGTDLNAYSVAKAFYKAFRVRSHAMGRGVSHLLRHSRFVKIEFCSGCLDEDVILPELFSFAKKHKEKKLILVPCADVYVELLIHNRQSLSQHYLFIVPNAELVCRLTHKRELYSILQKRDIPVCGGVYINPTLGMTCRDDQAYPVELSIDHPAEYWRYPYPDMKPTVLSESGEELCEAIKRLLSGGYRGDIVINEAKKNKSSYVYTVFVSDDEMKCFGVFAKVVLKDRECDTPLAVITLPENEFCIKLKSLLSSLGYRGFGSFDIVSYGGELFVRGFQAHQGRCCDCVLASGINPAEYLVAALTGEDVSNKTEIKEVLWHYPPRNLIRRAQITKEDKKLTEGLIKARCACAALEIRADRIFYPKRLYSICRVLREIKTRSIKTQ